MLWFSALISCGRLMPMTFACKAQLLTELSDLILNTLMEGGFCTQWKIDSRPLFIILSKAKKNVISRVEITSVVRRLFSVFCVLKQNI